MPTQHAQTSQQPSASPSRTLGRATRNVLREVPPKGLHDTVSEVFLTAAHQLRYEAVLEAVGHMGTDTILERGDGVAVGRREQIPFVKVYALPDGQVCVKLAVDPSTDERLRPCTDDDCGKELTSQFELGTSEPIRGWQLGFLRKAYRSIGS